MRLVKDQLCKKRKIKAVTNEYSTAKNMVFASLATHAMHSTPLVLLFNLYVAGPFRTVNVITCACSDDRRMCVCVFMQAYRELLKKNRQL